MKKTDRRALRSPPRKLVLCASLGALAFAVPGYAANADSPAEVGASAHARKHSCPTLVFTSTRDVLPADPPPTTPQEIQEDTFRRAEIYLMDLDPDADDPNPHGTNVRRLTDRNEDGDGFAVLSPDGKGRIVFDSNRLRGETGPLNTSDLFLMNKHGGGEKLLVHGGAPSWSPDGKSIAFHASADGTQPPPSNNPNAGATTLDSDIFIAKVGHLLDRQPATNLTNDGAAMIDGSPDWSPDGQTIVYRSHPQTNTPMNAANAEIYLRKVDGSLFEDGTLVKQLTNNAEEERAPLWSPDGSRIAYMCRLPGAEFNPPLSTNPPGPRFEICVMNADGTGQRRLTNNAVFDASPTWLPSAHKNGVLTHRLVIGRNVGVALGGQSLFMLSFVDAPGLASEEPLIIDWTGHPDPFEPQTYLLASYGVIKGKCK